MGKYQDSQAAYAEHRDSFRQQVASYYENQGWDVPKDLEMYTASAQQEKIAEEADVAKELSPTPEDDNARNAERRVLADPETPGDTKAEQAAEIESGNIPEGMGGALSELSLAEAAMRRSPQASQESAQAKSLTSPGQAPEQRFRPKPAEPPESLAKQLAASLPAPAPVQVDSTPQPQQAMAQATQAMAPQPPAAMPQIPNLMDPLLNPRKIIQGV